MCTHVQVSAFARWWGSWGVVPVTGVGRCKRAPSRARSRGGLRLETEALTQIAALHESHESRRLTCAQPPSATRISSSVELSAPSCLPACCFAGGGPVRVLWAKARGPAISRGSRTKVATAAAAHVERKPGEFMHIIMVKSGPDS